MVLTEGSSLDRLTGPSIELRKIDGAQSSHSQQILEPRFGEVRTFKRGTHYRLLRLPTYLGRYLGSFLPSTAQKNPENIQSQPCTYFPSKLPITNRPRES